MNQTIKSYLAMIGSKGGRAGRGTEIRKEIARRAAIIRWGNRSTAKLISQGGTKKTVKKYTRIVRKNTPKIQNHKS